MRLTNADLIESFMTDCTMMVKKRVPDGLGGFEDGGWTEDVPFRAAITKDQTLAARVAEKQGVTEVYTVTTAAGTGLDYHEVFRRNEDGQIFRVTSNSIDSRPPKTASFSFEQVRAERWELT